MCMSAFDDDEDDDLCGAIVCGIGIVDSGRGG